MIDDDDEFEEHFHDDFEDADFEDYSGYDISLDDEDADFYLDEADSGSAHKRRYTTRRHAPRGRNPQILSAAKKSIARSSRRMIAAEAKRVAKRHVPSVIRAANRALMHRIPDATARKTVTRLLGSQFVMRAASIAVSRAATVVTPRQVMRLPVLTILTAAAVEVARKSGWIDEDEAPALARQIFDALALVDMVVQVGMSVMREDDEEWHGEEDDIDLEDIAPYQDIMDEAELEASRVRTPCRCGASKGQIVTTSRALRNAARQLLRAERRLSGKV